MGVFGQIWLAAKGHWGRHDRRWAGSRQHLSWQPSGNYQSYMIRFWRTNANVPWRAAIVDPRRDTVHYFASREALYAFLDAQIDNHESSAQPLLPRHQGTNDA